MDNQKKVYSSDCKEWGHTTGSSQQCRLEGCNGKRLGVRWTNGKITYPCTKGMESIGFGNLKII